MAEQKTGRSSYLCKYCNKYRQVGFLDADHQALVEESQNGLVSYSDIHTCAHGLTSVNQLAVDTDYNIRSWDQLDLPKMRMATSIPAPKRGSKHGLGFVHLTQMPKKLDLHVIIHDHLVLCDIKIGRFNHEVFLPFTQLVSDMGMIMMDIFPSGSSYTPELELWLQKLIGIIEILPPTTLGLLVDVFRYIAVNRGEAPTDFDVRFMKTILASHEVFASVNPGNEEKLQELRSSDKFSQRELDMIEKFISVMEVNSQASMKDFTSIKGIEMDLLAIVYLFSVLENEEIIKIERPGILE